jgi:lipopolysaccharide/colanic/teichoic acid biosynthesis glycosyltransferase
MLLLSPVFAAIAIAVKFTSPGPVFFSQIRVGRYGRHFKFYKFRSMYIDAEARKAELMSQNESKDGVIFKMKDDPRITKVGKFIRRASLDELPQLWNVFIGDMSLVGPRPPVPKEVQEYTLEDRKRLDVIPGITCLWQINGRSEIPFHEQVRLDKEYIMAPGFWKDVKILLKTIPAIIGGKGAY